MFLNHLLETTSQSIRVIPDEGRDFPLESIRKRQSRQRWFVKATLIPSVKSEPLQGNRSWRHGISKMIKSKIIVSKFINEIPFVVKMFLYFLLYVNLQLNTN